MLSFKHMIVALKSIGPKSAPKLNVLLKTQLEFRKAAPRWGGRILLKFWGLSSGPVRAGGGTGVLAVLGVVARASCPCRTWAVTWGNPCACCALNSISWMLWTESSGKSRHQHKYKFHLLSLAPQKSPQRSRKDRLENSETGYTQDARASLALHFLLWPRLAQIFSCPTYLFSLVKFDP